MDVEGLRRHLVISSAGDRRKRCELTAVNKSAELLAIFFSTLWRRPPLQVDGDLDVTSVREVVEDGEAADRV